MTIDHPVRRCLARVCSPETLARVVDPTLADMRFERGRPAWRGYLALARALAVHAVTSAPSYARRVWHDDGHALPRVIALSLASAVIVALPFVLIPALGPLRDGIAFYPFSGMVPRAARTATMFTLLFPQALAITLPPALLLAVPLALRRHETTARVARRLAAGAAAFCVVMALQIGWVTPDANQRFRVFVSGNPRVARGEGEDGLTALRARIAAARRGLATHPIAAERNVRWLEYRYHMRLAMIVSPLPLAFLGFGLAATRAGRRHPWLAGIVAMTAYVSLIFSADTISKAVAPNTHVSPAILGWLPIVVTAAVAAAATRRAMTPGLHQEPA